MRGLCCFLTKYFGEAVIILIWCRAEMVLSNDYCVKNNKVQNEAP